MPSVYPWVSDGSIRKFHRAIASLTAEKKPITEEAVKELYVKWGGLVIEQGAQEEVVEEAPKKPGRPKKIFEGVDE